MNSRKANPACPPRTLEGLRALWARRDETYANRTLSWPEVIAIREWRQREAFWVEPANRSQAWFEASSWAPSFVRVPARVAA